MTTEVEPEPCRVPNAADKGVCAYAGPDGKDACGDKCIWQGGGGVRSDDDGLLDSLGPIGPERNT